MALTGDEEFVRIARLASARHGMHLDECGLWNWLTSKEAALERESQSQFEFEFDHDGDVPPPNWPGAIGSWWRAKVRTGSLRSSSSAGSRRSAATSAFSRAESALRCARARSRRRLYKWG